MGKSDKKPIKNPTSTPSMRRQKGRIAKKISILRKKK